MKKYLYLLDKSKSGFIFANVFFMVLDFILRGAEL